MKTNVTINKVNYYVDKEKKTIACVLETSLNQTFKGKSKCSEDDTFDEVTGKRIAESRAKKKLYKYLYNANLYKVKYLKQSLEKLEAKTAFCKHLVDKEESHIKELYNE